MAAIEAAGFEAGKDIAIALDVAASELYEDGTYTFKKSKGGKKSAEEMIALFKAWIDRYPIVSIEDGLAEDDWTGWAKLTESLRERVAKCNQLLRIAEELGDVAHYPGRHLYGL